MSMKTIMKNYKIRKACQSCVNFNARAKKPEDRCIVGWVAGWFLDFKNDELYTTGKSYPGTGKHLVKNWKQARADHCDYIQRERFSKENARERVAYLETQIAIARWQLEQHQDQDDHDIRHALGALDIDDPDWEERIVDPDTVKDQRALIDQLYTEIAELKQQAGMEK